MTGSFDATRFAEPGVPSDLIRYACGYDDFDEFLRDGMEVKTMLGLALENTFGTEFGNYENVLDFGCGCGRLTRHVRAPRLFGCDIHEGCVAYCKSNLSHADFFKNEMLPPLVFRDGLFDLVYAFSIFSVLDAEMENVWLAELARVGRPSCIYLLTVHGDWIIEKTLGDEAAKASEAGFYFKPAHRRHGCSNDFPEYCEASYHTASYIRNEWSRHFEIVDIIEGDQSARYLADGQAFAPAGSVPVFQPMGQALVIARKRA